MSIRLPDPIANTTTEAYLAYKAGVLAEGDLQPKLYEPYIHLDAWLAYWAGLTKTYPVKGLGKNLFDPNEDISDKQNATYEVSGDTISVTHTAGTGFYNYVRWKVYGLEEGKKYTASFEDISSSGDSVSGRVLYVGGTGWQNVADYPDKKVTFTVPSGSDWVYIALYARNGDTYTYTGVQIEEGEEATTYEPYTGEPEMLTDEEAFVAYLSGVTNTYPEEFKDPADIRVAGYLRYLVSARFGRPEYPVNNEELYLSMLKPPVVTNSTPSSDIELEGTCEAPFVDAKIYGDTKQNSYTGKNLFDPKILDYTAGLRFEFVEGDIIHIYGTPTAEWIAVTSNYNAGANMIDIPAGTTLSYASIVAGTGITSQAMRVRHSSAPNDSTDDLSNGTRTKTTTKDNNYMMFWIRCTIGTRVDAYIHLQVTASDTPDYDFEPFTGAIPSPSEFFPQVIETVTGHQSVRVIGSKNLFDKNKYLALSGYVDANDRIVHTINGARMVAIRCAPNTTYTVSKTAEGAQPRFFVFTTTSLPEYTMTISNKVGSNIGADTHTSYTITTGPNDEWLGVFLRVDATEKTLEEILDTLQIETGDTATEYTGYSGREYEINLGKNIADMSTYNYGNILADGTITDSHDFCRTNMLQIEEGARYTVWADVASETDNGIRIAFYDGHKQFLRRWSLTPDPVGSAVSVGAPEDASYMAVAFCIRKGMHRLQIEAGDTFTGYADYFEPIKLGELEGKSDYIFRDADGTWKIHRETFSGVLDGSADENWYVSGGAFKCNNLSQDAVVSSTLTYPSLGWGDMSADYYSYNYPSATHGKMGEAYCSGFIPIKSWEVVAGSGASHFGLAAINTLGGNSAIYIGSIQGVTIGQFREYLAADPIEVRYVLKTPYDEEITNQALIDQLDAFMAGGSDDTRTGIEVSAPYPELMAKLKIEAGEYR